MAAQGMPATLICQTWLVGITPEVFSLCQCLLGSPLVPPVELVALSLTLQLRVSEIGVFPLIQPRHHIGTISEEAGRSHEHPHQRQGLCF